MRNRKKVQPKPGTGPEKHLNFQFIYLLFIKTSSEMVSGNMDVKKTFVRKANRQKRLRYAK